MSGKHDAPMHNRPFDLIRATVTDAQGKPRFQRPLWLLVLGSRRRDISWSRRIRRTVSAMIWNTSSGLARPSYCWTGIRLRVSSTRSTGGSWSVWPISSCGWPLPWRFGYPDRGSATQPPRPRGRYRGQGRCSGSSSELFGRLGHRPSCPNGGVIPLGSAGTVSRSSSAPTGGVQKQVFP